MISSFSIVKLVRGLKSLKAFLLRNSSPWHYRAIVGNTKNNWPKPKNYANLFESAYRAALFIQLLKASYVRTCVRTSVRSYVCTYVRTYVCTYVRTYVRTYVNLWANAVRGRERKPMGKCAETDQCRWPRQELCCEDFSAWPRGVDNSRYRRTYVCGCS